MRSGSAVRRGRARERELTEFLLLFVREEGARVRVLCVSASHFSRDKIAIERWAEGHTGRRGERRRGVKTRIGLKVASDETSTCNPSDSLPPSFCPSTIGNCTS